MGAETLVHALADDTDVRVVVDRTRKLDVGEHLHIVSKLHQTLVFGPDGRLMTS
jgi:hypothetical protein